MTSDERRLPMVGSATDARAVAREVERFGGAGAAASTRPDPGRIRDGWEHRFVAAGARAQEMIDLYRELGYEVVADPVQTHALEDGCVACFDSGGEQYRSIYTRRPKAAPSTTHPTESDTRDAPMAVTHPTQLLRDEHRQILRVSEVLEGLLDHAPSATDYDRIDKCIRFIRLFADACHHAKEEDLLFPALEEEGLPHDSGPIAVMLHEHRLGRQFASAMAESIDAARAGDTPARERLVRAGRDYVGLIRAHILKEDNVLFYMADQMVVGSRCTRLCEAYDEAGAHTFDGCSRAELEELGREIVAGS